MRLNALSTGLASLALAGCGHVADIPVEAASGRAPQIVEPAETLLPTFDVAPATGWPDGAAPVPAQDLAVTPFAVGLDHPRWLHVLPNGDVLVAESAAPPQPELGKGIKGFFMKLFMKKAGSAVPSADRITSAWWLLPGVLALVLFAYLLARIEADAAGRAFAAYGGVYITASLGWLWLVEDTQPDRWDLLGALICLGGATVILFAPRVA